MFLLHYRSDSSRYFSQHTFQINPCFHDKQGKVVKWKCERWNNRGVRNVVGSIDYQRRMRGCEREGWWVGGEEKDIPSLACLVSPSRLLLPSETERKLGTSQGFDSQICLFAQFSCHTDYYIFHNVCFVSQTNNKGKVEPVTCFYSLITLAININLSN